MMVLRPTRLCNNESDLPTLLRGGTQVTSIMEHSFLPACSNWRSATSRMLKPQCCHFATNHMPQGDHEACLNTSVILGRHDCVCYCCHHDIQALLQTNISWSHPDIAQDRRYYWNWLHLWSFRNLIVKEVHRARLGIPEENRRAHPPSLQL